MPTLKRYANAAGFTDGLAGWWPLDEGSGTTAADRVGSATGTLVNNPTWVTGRFGTALSYSGSNYTEMPAAVLPVSSDYTISFWLKYSSTSNWYIVLSQGSNWASVGMWIIWLNTNGIGDVVANQLCVYMERGGLITKTGLTPNKWTHVVVKRGGTVMTMFINGVSAGTYNGPGQIENTNFRIARVGGYGGMFFLGSVDDVRIYNRALSDAQIKAMFFAKKAQYQ